MNTSDKIKLIDEFCKLNPLPDRTYCKELYKIQDLTLRFEYEYTKSKDIINELIDNDVDVDQYITKESQKKYDEAQLLQDKLSYEHGKVCTNDYCIWITKRDDYVKAHEVKTN